MVVLVGLGVLVWNLTPALREPAVVPEPDYWPTGGWKASSPEEQGFHSEKLAEGLQDIQEKQIDIDSLLVIRNGYVVLDAHFHPYDGTFPHDLASVTKSVMTTLIGIAADQGRLDLDQPVVSFFPDRTIASLDDRKAHMTVRHLAGMVNGMQSGCLDGDEPTIQAMRANPDYIQAALDRPMVSEPGREYCYDSPGMHLLSAVLQEATGMSALDFARQNLFEPLGIQDVIWETDPQGYNRGWGDLHMLPEDAAKIGYLWLHRGQWDGRQIVSEAWVLDSVHPHRWFVGDELAYGYGWRISNGDYYATGRGGQKIRVFAFLNTVVVTTGAGFEYDEVHEWLLPLLLRADGPLPANPEGRAALETALISAENSPAERAASPIPPTASQVSGKNYRCDSNPAGIETIRMEFEGTDQATMFLRMEGTDMVLPIGLDGRYRLSAEGTGFRGYWEEPQVFHFEAFDIGVVSRQAHFDGDRLELSLPEADLTVSCQAQGWLTSTPEEQGFDSARLAEGLRSIQSSGTQIHSLMILRNDRVILDAYFQPYDGSIYHDLASVTKSFMTTLIGIAADQGKLRLDDRMLSFFPDRRIANRDEHKESITVAHLASMSSGMDCAEIDPELTLMAMRATGDWVQYALDLPMVREPGTRFEYCGTDMHLLSAILKQATGMPALEFAHKYLFGPLGIQDVYWPADPQGITYGWGDLCLRPGDMSKLGALFMHRGEWQGRQIVSREWVENALQARMGGTGKIEDYGYGWWIGQPGSEPEFLATGNGGQKIKVYPHLQMIMVTTGGGFEYSEIERYLLAAMVDMEKPLPANPSGLASLQNALHDISQGPQPQPVPALPATADSISGQTFVFEPNRTGLLSLRIDFDQSAEAILQLEMANEQGPRRIGLGLDGVYRPSHAGRPILARASWTDVQTFVIDYNEGPGLAAYTIRLHFNEEEMLLEIPGLDRVKAHMQ